MPDDSQTGKNLLDGPMIVGVGASAGGLEAFQDFLSGLPDQHGLAIVFVQHLDPDHKSLLPELLRKRTRSPVQSATNGMRVKGGNIYLIPPGQFMEIRDDRLCLTPFAQPRALRRPIDRFLESLAENAGPRAVAVILSGTGSDGCTGVRAIKQAGGLVFVQDPTGAEYDGMPKAAIGSGADDLVLPANEMLDFINDYSAIRGDLPPEVVTDGEFIARVAKHVHYRTGHDFRQYKQATLLRRLGVRMSVLGLTNPNDYLKELIANKAEASKLFRDLLINVTGFMRDREVFEALRLKAIPELLKDRGPDDEIRVWVPGCSTGQEAFTIGMLILDEIDRLDMHPKVSIFASDIDPEAIRIARRAVYPDTIADELPAEWIERYFSAVSEGYEVTPRLREAVRFSNQSIVKDPPFSRVDLVSCRNVLIYFEPELQTFAMSVFHYALNAGAYLLLGLSETPRSLEAMFDPIDRRVRLFRRRPGPAQRLVFPVATSVADPGLVSVPTEPEVRAQAVPHASVLLQNFAPPYVVIDASGNLTYASERATGFLRLKPGSTRIGLTQLIVPELEPALRRLFIFDGKSEGELVSQEFRGQIDGQEKRIVLSCAQIDGGGRLIVLEDRLDLVPSRPVFSGSRDEAVDAYILGLELELERARETIRTNVEQLETSNEELKSSNEEMLSMNEELQSANEELATSNDELQTRITQLREANDDISNLIRSTNIATIFLDSRLRLRFFTPESRKILRFVETDKGRPIDEIGADIDIAAFTRICQGVIDTGQPSESEIVTRSGDRTFILRVQPYAGFRSIDNAGIVCSLTDISELSRAVVHADQERRSAKRRLEEIEQLYQASPQAMALIATDGSYLRVNRRMSDMNGISVKEHIGRHLTEVLPDIGNKLAAVFQVVMDTGEAVFGRRIEGMTAAFPTSPRLFLTDWYPVRTEGDIVAVGVNVTDITDQTEMSTELRRVMQELQHRVKNMLSNVLALVSQARGDALEDVDVLDTLAARIHALARTHRVLTRENWRAVEIGELLRPELGDVYGNDRIAIKGPSLTLNARAAVALGMALHELATNAAKYGAFSSDEGSVSLAWHRIVDGDEDAVTFRWKEAGGPRVVAPDKMGFGTQLIASTIEGSLRGEIAHAWEPDGLRVEIRVPFDELCKVTEDIVYDVL